MAKKPHIIIFNPDEMRWDTMSHMGNLAAQTPFLDRFAKEDAVSFRNAYCQNSVCVPSRCSFFTGLYPHVSGHRTMEHLLHAGEKNLFQELKEAGYYVWMNARNDLLAGQEEGWMEQNADEIFYGGEVPPAPGPIVKNENAHIYSHFEGQLGLDSNGKNITNDDETISAAIDKIKTWKEGEKPLCLFAGLLYPHVPYQIEEPYYSSINRNLIPERVSYDSCEGKSKMMELLHQYENLSKLSEEEWKELRAVYLAMCMKVDEQFGQMMQALKEADMYDNSAIFVLSDHGDFAGDYDLVEKSQNTMEDCLCRVPLLIKPPKGEGVDPGLTDAMTELVDFYATVMDYAKVTPERTHYGRSLRPVITDRTKENRQYVFCEGGRLPEETHCDEYHTSGPNGPAESFVYWPKMKAQTDDAAHAKTTMIRDHKYKYINRITGEDEFYDMGKDPMEQHNRISDGKYQQQIMTMKMELLKWLQLTTDVVPYQHDRRFTDEMMWAKIKDSCPAGYEADVKEKIHMGWGFGQLFPYMFSLKK